MAERVSAGRGLLGGSGGDPNSASNCTQASSACAVPKVASRLQIGVFSGRAPNFGTPQPVRAPRARAHAERWIGSLRRECLERVLIVGRRHLQHVVATYTAHIHEHRPHRS
jgi:Integrase core domain